MLCGQATAECSAAHQELDARLQHRRLWILVPQPMLARLLTPSANVRYESLLALVQS